MQICYKNMNLIDGTGQALVENTCMIVENGLIQAIGQDIEPNKHEDYQNVDLKGQFVMPGIIDCHTHVVSPGTADPFALYYTGNDTDLVILTLKNLENLLKSGVTYIRDVGDVKHITLQLKKYLKSGDIKGPGMHTAGLIITMTGGHGHIMGREADGVDEVIKATREQLKAGVDLIKVTSTGGVMTPGVDVNAYQFNVDELKAAATEAHKAGRKICTHSHGTQGVKNAVLAGIDCVEHGTILDEEAVQMMAEAGTYLVPTLSAVHFIVENGTEAGIPSFAVEKAKEVARTHVQSLQMAYKAGVKIAMGTDSGTPCNLHGVSSAIELELMVKAGMSPMDVIVASSKTAAELIGIDNAYGSLEVGKHADFLVLEENPLDNIKTVQNVISVYQNGQQV